MASQGQGKVDITFPAAGDLSSDQHKFVVLDTSGQVAVVSNTSTLEPIGVLQNKPSAQGRAATVRVSGISKVICGETIAKGDHICPSSVTAGRVDDADASTDTIIGIAIGGADAGEVISALIFRGGEVA